MRRVVLVLIVLLGLVASSADAAPWGARPPFAPPFRLEGVELEGDRLIDEDEALRGMTWRAGDLVPVHVPRETAAALQARLVRAGWWAADVGFRLSEETERGRRLTFVVEAGEPVVVGEIGVRGSRNLSEEEILARVDLRDGAPFDEDVFRADVARVLRLYSERGYPRARVYPSRFRRTADGRLGFDLRVSEGPAGRIESVRVFGNRQTESAVVARIAGVRPGDAWDPRRVESMAARLRRESLFSEVGEPRVVRGSRDDRLGIEITVEEGRSNSIYGVLGYNPNPDGGGEVVGLGDVDLRNLLGTARRAAFRFERQASDVQDLAFRYREPWLLGSPVSVEVGAAQARRDTLYSRTDLDLTVAFPLRARSTGRIAAERRDTSFDVAGGERVTETSTGGSVGLDVEARDRRLNPGRGWRAASLLGFRRTRDGVGRTRTENDLQVLIPLSRRWVISQEASMRGVWTNGSGGTPLYEQYFLGGTNTVRGYREEQFHGEIVWWTRTEARWRLARRSRAYLLGDLGGYRFEETAGDVPRTVEDVVFGAGFGVALETGSSGIVRFELALGRGDAFSDAKVHVGLEQEF